MKTRRMLVLIVPAILSAASVRAADPVEPPPESPADQDYQVESADSLDQDSFEVTLGAAGRLGESGRRTRSVRFSGDSLSGTLREGDGDPLAGGSLEGRAGGGGFGLGWPRAGAADWCWALPPIPGA